MITRRALAHATRIDTHAPGLLTALHVTGSPLLDDHVPGVSDLDLVGILSRPPTPADLAALSAAHTEPDVDAVYLQQDDLTRPATELPRPWGRDGTLNTTDPAYITPVLWDQLNRYSLTVRGPRPHTPVTREEVADYCRANLITYWQPMIDQLSAATTAPTEAILWVGTGPARLWHTIRTGDIIGKSQALAHAATHWPDLARALHDIAEARRTGSHLTSEHAAAAVELGKRILTC